MVRFHGKKRAAEIADAVATSRGDAGDRDSADIWKRIAGNIRGIV